MDSKDLIKSVKEDEVKFISLQFSDVTGAVKSVDMPVTGLEDALADGVWFDGSSVEGFARIQESDMHLRLDPDTYAVLTWTKPELRRARVFCDIYMPSGRAVRGRSPRHPQAHACRTREAGLVLQRRPGAGVLPVPRPNGRFIPRRMTTAATSISPPMTRPRMFAPS